MKTFLFVVALGCSLEALCALWNLSRDVIPQITTNDRVVNAALMGAVGVWALVLLLTGGA